MEESYTSLSVAEILPGRLFLGSATFAANLSALRARNIGFVVNAAMEIENFHELSLDGDEWPVRYLKLQLDDRPDEDLLQHVSCVCEFISSANKVSKKAVLVHCQAGISRSPSIVLAYLMKEERMSLKQSWMTVLEKKPNIGPNTGFVDQLVKFELQLTGTTTFDVREYLTKQLLNMGFSQHLVDRAIKEAGSNVNRALELIIGMMTFDSM